MASTFWPRSWVRAAVVAVVIAVLAASVEAKRDGKKKKESLNISPTIAKVADGEPILIIEKLNQPTHACPLCAWLPLGKEPVCRD